MACSRGKAAPDAVTIRRLFASSAGYCQRPGCRIHLFVNTGSKVIHVAEMAHIFAANDDGPRANAELSPEERGTFENLILLCPTCHKTIDKAPQDFPDELVTQWKRDHERKVAELFGAVEYVTREETLRAIKPLMRQNRMIHQQLNPDLDYRYNPEAEEAPQWKRKVIEQIIPNSRRILSILDANTHLMTEPETETLELFRQHVIDLEARHMTDIPVGAQSRFPVQMSEMMREGDGKES